MEKININGHEIRTNLGGNYPFGNGKPTATMSVRIKRLSTESDKDFVARLAGYGYTTISLKYCRTCVRGYYDVYALVK